MSEIFDETRIGNMVKGTFVRKLLNSESPKMSVLKHTTSIEI